MKPVALLAANFLRQHRWPVLLLFGWIALTALGAGNLGRGRIVTEDVVFYVQQQAIYICIFSAFLAADAIHNERKSRRILLVLSKAISRGEYLLAVVLGSFAIAVAYALVFGLFGVWLTARAQLSSTGVWQVAVLIVAGALVSGTAAIFFSTFLNPYLATACTLVVFSIPGAWHGQRHLWSAFLPGFPLLVQFVKFSFRAEWVPNWIAVVTALLEAVVFWILAAAVFERRDITVPVE